MHTLKGRIISMRSFAAHKLGVLVNQWYCQLKLVDVASPVKSEKDNKEQARQCRN